jgi:two-component system NtrC family sensor kinase
VNNPLFGILTYSRLVLKALERGEIDPTARAQAIEQLQIIERESKHCGEIMKNLLAFARQAPPRRQPQDLNALVRRASALVRHQLKLQGIELVESFAPGLPMCPCDGDQIQQVVLVLLVNAVEAMPRGGRMEITTRLDSSGPAAEVRVRDNGMGIAADVLPRIFEPFFTTKEDQHRTGLGLAVAQNIVEHHGGRLAASSTPEQGTEFTLALPLEGRKEETANGRA